MVELGEALIFLVLFFVGIHSSHPYNQE
jgi:hypothetical protein